jgi:hypothetical protein
MFAIQNFKNIVPFMCKSTSTLIDSVLEAHVFKSKNNALPIQFHCARQQINKYGRERRSTVTQSLACARSTEQTNKDTANLHVLLIIVDNCTMCLRKVIFVCKIESPGKIIVSFCFLFASHLRDIFKNCTQFPRQIKTHITISH